MSNLRNGSTAEKRCNRMGWIGMLVTLGIVFGDIGTSPLYVMKAILHVGQRVDEPMILGALSCIIWTLTLQTTVKYVLVALRADNHGEGGILALYALLRRHKRKWIYLLALMGAGTLLADGIITPAITVTTAIEGLESVSPHLPVLPITLAIITVVFFVQRFGKEGAFITKATAQLMRDFGSMQSPMNAYMLNLGLESLHVRMQRHCANGMAVAKFLEAHPKVAYVNYCGLASSPYHALAEKYLPKGSCGVVSFGLAGGREAASTFMKNLKLAAIETHVADARTCCLNPASSTHRQMNDEQLKAAGVPAELVRMSCGLESSEDLIADIAQALDKI